MLDPEHFSDKADARAADAGKRDGARLLIVGSVALDSVETPSGKVERALGGEYEALVERLLARATPDNLPQLAAIAAAYEGVKGYGVIKETKLEQVRKDVADAVAELETA